MASWWLATYWQQLGPQFTIAWVLWVILSITFHELAHGWVAVRCGDDVPIHTGHMTWNPFVHIPFPQAWIMFAVFGFTWGLMPTNPSNYQRRHDESRVAIAGPAMNLLLCAMCIAGDVIWLRFAGGVGDPMRGIVHTILWVGIAVNMMGFVFNLIPVPPLDGSRIAADFIPTYARWRDSESGQIGMLIGMIALSYFGAPYVWEFVFNATSLSVKTCVIATGGTYVPPTQW